MSGFDLTGGLAALRSQILSPDSSSSQHRHHHQQQQQHAAPRDHHSSPPRGQFGAGSSSAGPPQLPRLQTDFSSNDFFTTTSSSDAARSDHQRGSAESSSTSSGRSGPSTGHSTALTTPNASLEQPKSFGAPSSGWPPSGGPSERRDSSLSAVSASNTASVRGSSAVFAYSDHLLTTTSPLLNGGNSGSFSGPSRSGSRSTSGGSASASASVAGSRVNSGYLSPNNNMAVAATASDVGDESFATEASTSASAHAADAAAHERAKKANPLQDLIQTEKAYVSELSMIIRKVASAWNRSNFPPAELDIMFRNIESIYRIDKAFLKSLKEIGPEPSSPRALGDLLMRWIDDLETPYARYCENYFTDFDTWPAVQSNGRLLELLAEISDPSTSEAATKGFSDKKRQLGDAWTLDGLFALPQLRLKYYKKLYARLLKSTNPGRSDHRLLVGANEKLDELLEKATRRISMSVLDDSPMAQREREAAINSNSNLSAANGGAGPDSRFSPVPPSPLSPASPTGNISSASLLERIGDLNFGGGPSSGLSGNVGSDGPPSAIRGRVVSPGVGGGPGFGSAATPPPPLIPPFTAQTPLSADDIVTQSDQKELPSADELERALDMSRVLDLFTMKPKKCQLRINPETLPFKRGMRKSADVVIEFKPMSTREDLIWRRGHIFLLTDLFLICDRMTPSERAERGCGPDGMWLLFPPLAGKHLQVADKPGPGNALTITILKKETLTVQVESREEKEAWMRAFADCNEFATQMGLKLKNNPPPPVSTSNASACGLPGPPSSSIMSPTISVTPSESLPRLPQDRAPSSLARDGSVTSVGSFPQVRSSSQSGSSDPLSPSFGPRASPASARPFSPSSASPPTGPQAGPSPRSPGFRPAGPPAGTPPGALGARPMMRPPYPNGPGPGPNGPGMMNGRPPPPQMQRPPPPPGGQSYGRPPPPRPESPGFRPPMGMGGPGGPPGSAPPRPRPDFINRPPPQSRPSQGLRESDRRPSAPNLRDRANGAMTPPVRTRSASSMGSNGGGGGGSGAAKLPSAMMKDGDLRSMGGHEAYSPPSSPNLKASGPTTSTVSAQMRCRLYLKQSHAQWKSLGNARLKLYHIMPVDHKQLVVENDRKMLISTIVLSDGVERVGKVGVAVEVSDQGNRTGIIYMLQMRSEESAQGLFGELIDGSGRTVAIG